LVLVGCGGDTATLATFAGAWQGHARSLAITRSGDAQEWFTLGLGTATHPAPRVGESRRILLRDGVLTAPLAGAKYCGPTARHWTTAQWLGTGSGA
jgi:hypothetical protein